VKKEIKAIKIAIILQETIFNMPGKFLLVVIQNDVVSFTLRLSAATTQFELDKKVGHGIPMKVWMINAFLDMNVITWVRIGSAVGEAVAVILSHLGVSKSIIEKLSQATVAVSNTNAGWRKQAAAVVNHEAHARFKCTMNLVWIAGIPQLVGRHSYKSHRHNFMLPKSMPSMAVMHHASSSQIFEMRKEPMLPLSSSSLWLLTWNPGNGKALTLLVRVATRTNKGLDKGKSFIMFLGEMK
jgi:hypothetical protein